jgi:hypothetical protein
MAKAAQSQAIVEIALKVQSELTPPEVTSTLVAWTVQPSTLYQYETTLSPYRSFLIGVGACDAGDPRATAQIATQASFALFLLSSALAKKDEPARRAVSATLRSALRKQQEVAGLPLWACDPEVVAMVKGARYQGGTGVKRLPRGTLTPPMWEAFVVFTTQHACHMLGGFTVQKGCALRISQLIGILSGHVSAHPAAVWLVEDKRETAMNVDDMAVGPQWKRCWCEESLGILLQLQHHTPLGLPLFPRSNWSVPQFNAHIRAASVALKWPVEVIFDGSHVMRHTGIGEAKAKGVPDADLLLSHQMIGHYGKPLAERIAQSKKRAR